MVNEPLNRFPWTYSEFNTEVEGQKVHGYRVRIDFIMVTNPQDSFKLDIYHFTNQSDLLDNGCLAKETGLDVKYGHEYIYVTPSHFSSIYQQIYDFDKSCV